MTFSRRRVINRIQSSPLWRLFVALFVGGLGLLLIPRPYSSWLMVFILLAMIYLAVRGSSSVGWEPLKLVVTAFDTTFSPYASRILRWLGRHRPQLAFPLTIAACLLFVASAYNLRPELGGMPVDEAARYMVLGGVLLGLALWWSNGAVLLKTQLSASVEETVTKTRWLSLAAGIGLLAVLMWVNGIPAQDVNYQVVIAPLDVHGQVAVWIAGMILVARGLSGKITHINPINRTDEPTLRPRSASVPKRLIAEVERMVKSPRLLLTVDRIEMLAVVAITLLALFLRTYNLELIHRFIDEAHWFDAVPRISDFRDTIRVLYPFSGTTAFTWIYPYFEAWFVGALGPSFTSIRMLSALVGTAGVAAVYYLARTLFDRPTALLAMLLLAAFPPHVHFSRIALNNIADPLFGTLGLAFLARGMQTWQRRHFVLAGVMLGLTQYFYEGGRLFFPPLMAVWAYYWFIHPLPKRQGENALDVRRRSGRVLRNLLLMIFTAALIALPVYYTLFAYRLPFAARFNEMSTDPQLIRDALTGTSPLFARHLLNHFLTYVQLPESGWFYGGHTALLLAFMVPPFLLGIWHAIWRARHAGAFLMLVWLISATVGISLTRDFWSARFVVVFPVLMLLAAFGIRCTLPLLAPLLGVLHDALRADDSPDQPVSPFSRRYTRVLLHLNVLIGVLLSILHIHYYFNVHIPVYLTQARVGSDVHDALFRAVHLPDGTNVHIITDQALFEFDVFAIVRFWNRQGEITVDIQPRITLTAEYFRMQTLGVPHAFFIEINDQGVLALMRTFYVTDPPRVSPYGVPANYQMLLYFAPPGSRLRQ
jgi:hypothetical protein